MSVTPVSSDGVRQLWSDNTFLRKVVTRCPLFDLFEPFDESDAWWFACARWESMKQYGRRDLRRTILQWIVRLRPVELYEIRARANKGEFDSYMPRRDA